MSNILILVGSPRVHGNTELLANAFAEGARVAGHEVEILNVARMNIAHCIGCNTCFTREGNACARHDDMDKVYAALARAEVLIIASPVYFYGISSQMAACIDRLHTPLRNTFHIHKACLLLCGAASLENLFDAITTQYEMALKFFNIQDCGRILVRSVKDKGDVQSTTALEDARRLGATI
ncbi:MAG: flavodoxin family protein [Fibrobacter sp.]|nr:flavodoxin family protein [Fibrobacter sp.]